MKQVGATPFNRGGEGLLWMRAHTRVEKISDSGCSLAAIRDNAVLLEDNPYTKEFANFTEALCKTDAHYANYESHTIKAANLGATHAFHGFACVYDEVQCEIETISVNGKMSRATCFQGDPMFEEFTMVGIPSVVLRWELYALLPECCKTVMRALNTVQQISDSESWVQNLLTIVTECKGNENPDMRMICKKMCKSQPPRWEDIPSMCDYIKVWGGLPSGIHVKDMANVLKHAMPPNRIVSGQTFKSLTEIHTKFPVQEVPPHVINLVLTSHAVSNSHVQDGFARYVSKGDVSLIASEKKRSEVVMLNNILRGVKDIHDRVPITCSNIELRVKFILATVDVLLEKTKTLRTFGKLRTSTRPTSKSKPFMRIS